MFGPTRGGRLVPVGLVSPAAEAPRSPIVTLFTSRSGLSSCAMAVAEMPQKRVNSRNVEMSGFVRAINVTSSRTRVLTNNWDQRRTCSQLSVWKLLGTGAGLGLGWKAADKAKVEANTLYLGPRRDVNRKVLAIVPKTPDWKAKSRCGFFRVGESPTSQDRRHFIRQAGAIPPWRHADGPRCRPSSSGEW